MYGIGTTELVVLAIILMVLIAGEIPRGQGRR